MQEQTIEKCRTCLKENLSDSMISLSADHVASERVMPISALILLCSSVEVSSGDGFPQFICLDCLKSAEKSYSFRILCQESDKALKLQTTEDIIIKYDSSDDVKDLESANENESEPYMEIETIDDEMQSEILEENVLSQEIIIEKDGTVTEEVSVEFVSCPAELSDDGDCEIVVVQEENYNCSVCELKFPSTLALNKHFQIHQVTPTYFSCSKCTIRFATPALLKKHILKSCRNNSRIKTRRSRKKGHKCALCSQFFPTILELRSHVSSHETQFKKLQPVKPKFSNECPKCQVHFENEEDMKKHFETHEKKERKVNVNKYICQYCFEGFSTSILLQQHLKIHNEGSKEGTKKDNLQKNIIYKCNICDFEFNALSCIKEHLVTHEIETKDIFKNIKCKCTECEDSPEFNTIYEHYQHSLTHINIDLTFTENVKRKYVCSTCGKCFTTRFRLSKHKTTHESQWPKKCKYCENVLATRADYMKHVNDKHDDMKTYVCNQCGKKFIKDRNLQSHLAIHSGERNYMCDICGFSFHAQNNLVSHRRLHTGVKPYKCTYCPKAFSQYAGLRSHLINHTGERKYSCPICNKKFARISAQKNHIKTHTGEKDYACHLCDKRFGASSTRKKHLLTHTGERNHICDFCGKAFSRRSNLNVHRKIHTGETPHVCEICGKGFIQAHVLRSHRNTHRKQQAIEEAYKAKNEEINSNDIVNNSEELTILVDLN